MKIFHRVLIAPAICTLALILFGAAAFMALQVQREALNEVHAMHTPESTTESSSHFSNLGYQSTVRLANSHTAAYRLLAWQSNLDETKTLQASAQISSALEALQAQLLAQNQTPLAHQIGQAVAKYKSAVTQAIDLSIGDAATGASSMQTADRYFQNVNKQLEALIAQEDHQAQLAIESASAHAALWMKIAMFAFMLGIALSVGASSLIARSLSRPVATLVTAMNRIAEGDLTCAFAGGQRSDEIGVLSRTASAMQDRLHKVTLEVRNDAASVNQGSEEIAGAIDAQAVHATEVSATVAEITATMEELSASSAQIAEHSRSVFEIAKQTWENSKEGSEAMQAMLARMADIGVENRSSLAEIVALGNKSKEISRVMVIINTVADQTKLIAFNAALEASSAGESGRRFSVVAAEIRRLADSVTDSTGEIEARINEIQNSISRLVITSEKGAHGIADGMAVTNDTADRMNNLVDAASQTSSAAQQIQLSTQQQKTASGQVVTALREIVHASVETAQSLRLIAQVSHQMSDTSSQLRASVSQFKLGS